jgi:hypothetical protein
MVIGTAIEMKDLCPHINGELLLECDLRVPGAEVITRAKSWRTPETHVKL